MDQPRTFHLTLFKGATLKREPRPDGVARSGDVEGDVVWLKAGTTKAYTLDELVELLTTKRKGNGKYTYPLFIAAKMEGGKKKEHFRGASCLVVDMDDQTVAPDEVAAAFSSWAYVVYTTYQHARIAPRCRLVLPLSRDVTWDEYRALWNWANERLGEKADPHAADATRANFLRADLPDSWAGFDSDMPLLDVEPIIADYREPESPAYTPAPPTAGQRRREGPPDSGLPQIDPAAILAGIPEGGRDSALFRYACQLRARGARKEEAEVLIAQAAQACTPPFDEHLARKKVSNVWASYPEGKGSEQASDANALDALAILQDVETRFACAEGPSAKMSVLTELMDDANVQAMATLYRLKRSAFDGAMARIGTVRGMKGQATALALQVKAAAKDQEKGGKKAHLRVAQPGESVPDLSDALADVLADHVIPTGLLAPFGFIVNSSGVFQVTPSKDEGGEDDEQQVARCPVLVTGRLVDVEDGTTTLRVEWMRRSDWLFRIAPREHLFDAKNVIALAKYDFPVSSVSSRGMVKYLAAFEADNLERLPSAMVSSRMGWQGDRGKHGFLWGKTLIRSDGETAMGVDVAAMPPSSWREDWIHLHPGEGGASQIVDGYSAAGSFAHWRDEVYLPAMRHPRVAVAFYASLVPPLLEILGDAPNFIVDYAGATSQGKTTTLRVAASLWGSPDEREDGVVYTWDATPVWIERTAALIGGMPLILDDSKRAKDSKQISKVLYDVAHGKGRGRGSVGGIRATSRWRTVLLSTGEAPATSYSQDGGTRARTLVFWGSPFGKVTVETSATVRGITRGALANYGHVGPAWVRWLTLHRAEWPAIKARYHALVEDWAAKAGADPVAGRVAQYVALLALVSEMVPKALKLQPGPPLALVEAWNAGLASAGGADRATAAALDVIAWATGRQSSFYGRHEDEREPTGGWLGSWSCQPTWPYIGVQPRLLKEVLEKAGFDHEAIIETWADRGWLYLQPTGGQRTINTRVGKLQARVTAIHRDVYDRLISGTGIGTAVQAIEGPPLDDEQLVPDDDWVGIG